MEAKSKGLKNNEMLKSILKSDKLGLMIALIIIVCVFNFLTGGKFFTGSNIINVLIASAIVGLVTIGESFLLISGQVDLSPGSVAAFSGVLVALFLSIGMNVWIAIILVIICGMLVGVFNSMLVTKFKFEPFIGTLATMSIFRGFAFILCGGKAIFITNPTLLKIGVGRILGIPIPVVIFFILFIVFALVSSKTRFGRSVYMIGGNANAARLAGINAFNVRTKLYMLTSAFAAIGGIILAARMSTGQPSASVGLEFDAVTAAVLGGIAMGGGIGSLSGALIGLFIMQGFNNGLMMLNVQSFWQTVAKGILLIAALSFDYYRNRQREQAEKQSIA
ncbi:ABC transporter permease [Clostridium grantii]|uniref:Ribose transport system permease protein n=1 Tax=Clostridium grantii DSM 8605 TaxID=1121316 RepID=A0A1M5WZA2_9CLOT|nr:ABC transporter permease [Clostridium grantii]SHH93016.1 ribose transport system permease protein [Clostridium grantii DSM 8605]